MPSYETNLDRQESKKTDIGNKEGKNEKITETNSKTDEKRRTEVTHTDESTPHTGQ